MKAQLIFALLALLFCLPATAQDSSLYVYGTIRDYSTRDSLPYSQIDIKEIFNGKKHSKVLANGRGRFEFYLERNRVYSASFSSEGRVAKSVEINLLNAPDSLWDDGGVAMNIDMTLFREVPGISFSLLEQPIGKCKYYPATDQLAWDLAYTEKIKGQLEQLLKKYQQAEEAK